MSGLDNRGLLGACLVTLKALGATTLPWAVVLLPYWGPGAVALLAALLSRILKGILERRVKPAIGDGGGSDSEGPTELLDVPGAGDVRPPEQGSTDATPVPVWSAETHEGPTTSSAEGGQK